MDRNRFCHDVLTIAVETGIGYWAEAQNPKRDPGHGGLYLSIEIKDEEDPEDPWHLIDETKITEAINKIITDDEFPINQRLKADIAGAWATNDAGMIDCDRADVIIQTAAYGEIVFG